ncbi:MAG: aminoglycoside adenylyltransferase family protein [bacterium]
MTDTDKFANTKQQITQCLKLLQEVLGDDLLGMYLYGSSLVGGLHHYSDLDMFVISNRSTTKEEKAKLAAKLLKISGINMVSKTHLPIEVTIVVKSEVNPWHYPPTFDFQYGDWMRKDFESGKIEPWESKEMPGLALIITQLLLANMVIYGPAAQDLLDQVPYSDFIKSMTTEMDSLVADLDWDTRNVLLTLARIWNSVTTDTICSKEDAADFAIELLPEQLMPVLLRAKQVLLGETPEHWDDLKIYVRSCADFMVKKIDDQMILINSSDYSNKSIALKQHNST